MTTRRRVLQFLAVGTLRFLAAGLGYSVIALLWRYGFGRLGLWPLWLVFVATVGVAAMLSVLRRPTEWIASQVAFGDRAAGYDLMRDLLAHMSQTLPVEDVVPRVAEAVGRTAHSDRAEVTLWLSGGSTWSQVWPPRAPSADELAGPSGSASPRHSETIGVRHAGEQLGEIDVQLPDSPSSYDRRLVEELAGPAGLAMSTVRLTYELRRRASELQKLMAMLRRSNRRILRARLVEQQRFQDEIDARVMPQIAAARSALEMGVGANPLQAAAELGGALDQLRTISRGIYPPVLAEAGLPDAVHGWPARRQVPAEVAVTGDLHSVHARPELEACVYFCVVTALDALADRDATDLAAQVDASGTEVAVTVSGRGCDGIASATTQALRDRVEAFDGEVRALFDVADACRFSVVIPLDGLTVEEEQ